MAHEDGGTGRLSPQITHRPRATDCLLVTAVVLVAALLGSWAGSSGIFGALWPANPLLIGMFVRWPALARPTCVAAATAAFVTADLVTGSAWDEAVVLTAGNVACILVGYLLMSRLAVEDRFLRRPRGVPLVFLVCVGASVASAAVAPFAGPHYFGMSRLDAVQAFFSAELANQLTLLPVVLAAPPVALLLRRRRTERGRARLRVLLTSDSSMIVLALAVAADGDAERGGPAAIVFSVPVLLWSALSGTVFRTALLVLLSNVTLMVALGSGHLELGMIDENSPTSTRVSMRIALALITMGPLMVAAAMRLRDDAITRLQHVLDHDGLTGTLSRDAFLAAAQEAVRAGRETGLPLAVLMLDIDHFKLINDEHGHRCGDEVLSAFATTARASLRSSDLLGRVGGEEFGLVLPGTSADDAHSLAERIRADVARARHGSAGEVRVTVSIGLAHSGVVPGRLDDLLHAADEALYEAKRGGRDCVVRAPAPVGAAD